MIEVGKNLTWHSNFINIIITGSETKPSMSSDEFAFLENILLSQIFGMNFVCLFVVTCHVLLLLSSTMLRAGLVDSMSCTVAVFDHVSCGYCRQYVMYCCCLRPCFVRVLSCIIGAVFDHALSTVCHVLLLLSSTMLRAGLVDSMSCIIVAVFDHASCGSCRQYVMYCCCLRPCFVDSMSCIIVAVFDHASCGSCRQYVMYYCCCLRPCFVWVLSTVCHVLLLSSTMLRAGLVDSMSCIIVAVFDHASCGSCRQCVMYCCCLRPCFVRVLSCIIGAVFDHALCRSCRQYVMYYCCCLRPCFVRVLSTVCHVLLLLSSTMLRAGLVDSMSCIIVAVFDHASCGSCRQYVMYYCCCLRPCFVRV